MYLTQMPKACFILEVRFNLLSYIRQGACGVKNGKNVAIIDVTWQCLTIARTLKHVASTLTHEIGHLVSLK